MAKALDNAYTIVYTENTDMVGLAADRYIFIQVWRVWRLVGSPRLWRGLLIMGRDPVELAKRAKY